MSFILGYRIGTLACHHPGMGDLRSRARTAAALPYVGYLRVSMKREEMISPAIQRAAQERYARAEGIVIGKWVEDLDNTGRNFRRKVMGVIGWIEAGEYAGVLVYRFDRWGRNAQESLANVARVEHASGRVISVTEPFDAETAVGKYTRTNAFALAEMQSDIIGENWSAALRSRVERGLPATGTPRFGYVRRGRIRRDDDPKRFRRDPEDGKERYEPDPVQGPLLTEMYHRYIAGDGRAKLLKWLNGTGQRTTKGAQFSPFGLFAILDSGFGAGLLRVHDPECKCHGKTLNACRNAVYLKGAHEPVIEWQTWEAYLWRREDMRGMGPRTNDPVYPLAGLVRCGECKATLSASKVREVRGAGYRCPSRAQHRGCKGVWVQRRAAEDRVREEVGRIAGDINRAAAAVPEQVTSGPDTAALEREVARLDRALAKSVRDQALDEVTPAVVYLEARRVLAAEREEKHAALKAARKVPPRPAPDVARITADIMGSWDVLPAGRLREILRSVIREVRVTRTGPRTPPDIRVVWVWEPED